MIRIATAQINPLVGDLAGNQIKIVDNICRAKAQDADVIVFPDRVQSHWHRREGRSLCMEDLDTLLAYTPDIFIMGTGASGVLTVPSATQEAIEARGITFVALRTAEACQQYNAYMTQGKRVVAGLHLTC